MAQRTCGDSGIDYKRDLRLMDTTMKKRPSTSRPSMQYDNFPIGCYSACGLSEFVILKHS